MNYYTRAIPIH